MRHDHRLQEAGFGGLIGVLDDGDPADRRAAFRSDFDAGHVGALNLELRPVAVITAAAPRQTRREVGKAQPVLSRHEAAEVEIALLVRLWAADRHAESYDLARASGFRIDHRSARNRLARFIINDAPRRFIAFLRDAEPDVNACDFAAGGHLDDFRLIFIGRVGMPYASELGASPGR